MLVLGIASFVIAAIGVVVAVLSFMKINNGALRYALGSACLLLTLLFSIVGLYAFFNVIDLSTLPVPENQEAIVVTDTLYPESRSTALTPAVPSTPIPTSELLASSPEPPTITPKTQSQPAIEPISLVVAGNAEQGVRHDFTTAGRYRITLESGSYSPWPEGQHADGQWRTILRVYKNREVEFGENNWGLQEPARPDHEIGCWDKPAQSQSEVEACGHGDSFLIDLQSGDYLVFEPIDEQGAYNGNRGELFLSIVLAPP